MQLLNLGILAHVDAGKTTLTERLLFETGVLDGPGSVDAGTTRTDSMDLERRRGITIRSAVTSFAVHDLTVNLIDTPGHPDFIAEVERALRVLDGAVLVVSAVEGVQPQTVVLWRALETLGVPTLMFLNKLDRRGADPHRVTDEITQRLTPNAVPLFDGGTTSYVEALAAYDDELLDGWLADRTPTTGELDPAVRRMLKRSAGVPVLAGSARTGAGVSDLVRATSSWFPRAGCPGGAAEGVVFAVDRDERGKRVFLRLRRGTITVRERVRLSDGTRPRITGIQVSTPRGLEESVSAKAGEIAVVRGLDSLQVGDTLGDAADGPVHRFPTPALETVLEPVDPTQRGALFAALTQLAEQDPLIALHVDATEQQLMLRLHGEVQAQVIAALLAEQYGIEVTFGQSGVVCVERVVGVGTAAEFIGVGDNPYLATIGLRVEPAAPGSGVSFSLEVEAGSLPQAFFRATEEGVRDALGQGLHGWAIQDCSVTMTESGYWPRQSHAHQKFNKAFSSVAADFRRLGPVVLMTAVQRAGTQVCEPVDRFTLEVPTPSVEAVLALVGRLGGSPLDIAQTAAYCRIQGHLPTARLRDLAARLPDLTRGSGAMTSVLDHHRPVHGPPPRHPSIGPHPLDRHEWFRRMPR